MKIFDFKNPRHLEILREELHRAKMLMLEASTYNEDKFWDAMTEDERWDAIAATADDDGPNLADKYYAQKWDNVPDSITDHIDMSKYKLARFDVGFGASLWRGIQTIRDVNYKNDPDYEKIKTAIQKLIDEFCKETGRTFENLTSKQAMTLNVKVQRLAGQLKSKPGSTTSSDDSEAKRAWLDAERRAGRTSGLD
jgi:hypothetical protein